MGEWGGRLPNRHPHLRFRDRSVHIRVCGGLPTMGCDHNKTLQTLEPQKARPSKRWTSCAAPMITGAGGGVATLYRLREKSRLENL